MALQFLLFLLLVVSAPAFALRIVSLLPSNTEIVEALGAGDELVGVCSFDAIPKGSSRVNVGNLLDPQWEVLVSLHPDLVLTGRWASSPAAQRLEALHIPRLEVEHPPTMAALYDSIRLIAKAIKRPPENAERVIQDMQSHLRALGLEHAGQPLLPVYLEIDPPTWTIGAKDYLNEGLEAVGLENVFRTMPRLAAEVSSEAILQKNPGVIITLQGSALLIRRRPGWSTLAAVQKGWIIDDIPADDLVRPSPRLIKGLERLNVRLRGLQRAR